MICPKKSNSIIGSIYRHPSMPGEDFVDEHLRILTHKLNNEKDKQIYIAGDFNFDLLKVSTDQPTSDFFDIMTSNFLLPTISLPTKINNINNTLIDNIFTNQFDPDLISGNITVGISDHLPSFLIKPNANQHHLPKKQNIYRRNFKNFNQENFFLDLLAIDWDKTLEIHKHDANHSFNSFYLEIDKLLNFYIPLKR